MPIRSASLTVLWLALHLLCGGPLRAQEASLPEVAGPYASALASGVRLPVGADTIRRRPRAVEYTEWYERRATIHRVASWITLPLFAAEVVTGQELYKNGPEAAQWAKDYHGVVAGSLGGLFALNTLTGGWNLIAARQDPAGRKWRTAHALLMLTADAGFAYAGSLANAAEESSAMRDRHRMVAITSSSIALVSYLMMLPPLRRD